MSKPFAEQAYDDARAAGCDHDLAVSIVLHLADAKNAKALATAVVAAKVPADLTKALFRNRTLGTDAQLIAAFRQAAEVQALINMGDVPEQFRDIRKFTVRDAAGNVGTMPFAQVGRIIVTAMADADVHIDTSRSDADSRNGDKPQNEFDAIAVQVFAKLAKARKGVTQ